MKTIVVSGSESGVGKTYLAQQLLSCLKNWSALKVTVSRDGDCPHQINCGICPTIKEPFYIIQDDCIINQPGKDTHRLKAAGAKEVIWLKAKPEGLKEGLVEALAKFSDCQGVVIEGTSVLKFIKPDLNIHIEGRCKTQDEVKSEIRISKSETMSKFPKSQCPKFSLFWTFENSNFEFVSNFEFRASNLIGWLIC